MEPLEIQRIRGTNDVIPPRKALQRALEDRIGEIFSLSGYEPVDTPVLEPTDLFLRKSGEEIAARMYSFTHWNRNLCLRPEFTASVIRAYVNHLQERSLPVRLQYAGPTFRYEKPQRGRHRQFTEVGVECIGPSGPTADAEVLAVARQGLEAVGLSRFQFVVGHLGAVLQLLAQLGMEPRAQGLVLGVMEHLARTPGDRARTVDRLAAMLGAGPDSEPEPPHPSPPPPGGRGLVGEAAEGSALVDLLRTFGPEAAARIAEELLEQADFRLEGGGRPPSEIVERLLRKAYRPDPVPALRRSVEFISRLRDAAGPPDEALPALRRLLQEFGLDDAPVREIEQALACFDAHFDTPALVHVNLSLARGLRYYTGLVFEVYDDQGNQVAGGGRYDELVRALGGRIATPACGFSYGLERLFDALERTRAMPPLAERLRVGVIPVAAEDYPVAARLAMDLRRDGVVAEVDLRFRGLKSSLRHADHRRLPLVVVVGERERAEGLVTLRDMRAFEEIRVPLDDLAATVQRRLQREAGGSTSSLRAVPDPAHPEPVEGPKAPIQARPTP